MKLVDIRKKKYNLEEDSNCDAWEFYLDFYEKLSCEKLIKSGARLVHPVDSLPDVFLGGDVIINTYRMPKRMRERISKEPKRYDRVNIGLLPCQGNFQIIKKRCGNDYRIDLFIKMIDDYYITRKINPLLYKAKMWKNDDVNRHKYTKEKLTSILEYYGKTDEFVKSFYGICDADYVRFLVNKPEDRDEKAVIDMIEGFWNHRQIEINNKFMTI